MFMDLMTSNGGQEIICSEEVDEIPIPLQSVAETLPEIPIRSGTPEREPIMYRLGDVRNMTRQLKS